MWKSLAERTFGRGSVGGVIILLASATATLACDIREVALRAAVFNSCGTVWAWNSALEIGDLYTCEGKDCGADTVLRISRTTMSEDDRRMSREALLKDWENRVIPATVNGFKFQMLGPVATPVIAGERGALLTMKVTNPDGTTIASHVFRIPLKGEYLVVNATGQVEPDKLRGFLGAAMGNLAISPGIRQ